MSGATAAGLLQLNTGWHSITPCLALAVSDERGHTAVLLVIKVRSHHAALTPTTLADDLLADRLQAGRSCQGRRQGFRPGWAKFGAKRRKNFFSFAHPGFQFAHPAIRNSCPPCPPYRGGFKGKGERPRWLLIKRAPSPPPPSDLALQLGLVIHTPMTTGKR